jgi:hypothetical protein
MDPRCHGGWRRIGIFGKDRNNDGPQNPLWYRKEVGRVIVFPIWSARCRGFQMMRWSMHVARPGWRGGVKMGVSAPSHIKNGRKWTWTSFGVKPVQTPLMSPPSRRR